MYVAGIDAHATYSVIAIVSNTGQLVEKPMRIKNRGADRLDELLDQYRPLEVVVETSLAWPWLFDRLAGPGIHFVLAHAKRLRVIAESNYKPRSYSRSSDVPRRGDETWRSTPPAQHPPPAIARFFRHLPACSAGSRAC